MSDAVFYEGKWYKTNICPKCGEKESLNFSKCYTTPRVACEKCRYEEDLKYAERFTSLVKTENELFKVFISQPMRGLTLDEVKYNREQAIMNISNMTLAGKDGKAVDDEDLLFFDNIQEDLDPEITTSLDYLGNDVKMLGHADLVYFVSGWEKSRGCNIEYQICKDWDIPMIFEQGGI